MDNNERILGIKEIARIYEINDAQLEELQRDITNISEDMQIRTMSMEMCRKKEKDLDLKGQDNDTVQEKRFRIRGAENERTPYTLEVLKKRMDEMIGSDRVYITISDSTVYAKIALESKKSVDFIKDILEQIIPLDLLINIELIWNSYEKISSVTHEYLSTKRHIDIKEEPL